MWRFGVQTMTSTLSCLRVWVRSPSKEQLSDFVCNRFRRYSIKYFSSSSQVQGIAQKFLRKGIIWGNWLPDVPGLLLQDEPIYMDKLRSTKLTLSVMHHTDGNILRVVWTHSIFFYVYLLCHFHCLPFYFPIHSHRNNSLRIFSFKIDLCKGASIITQILLPLIIFTKVHYAALTFGIMKIR